MTNQYIADHVGLVGKLLQLTGENEFKVRAYDKASTAIEAFEGTITDAVAAGKMPKIEGVGASIEKLITEVVQTGDSTLLSKLRTEVPAGVVQLSRIRGLGPKKLQLVWRELGITSPEQLRQACLADKLSSVKGLGVKLQEGLLQAVDFYLENRNKMRLDVALATAQKVTTHLQLCPAVQAVQVTGPLRRNMPVNEYVALVVQTDNAAAVQQYLAQPPLVLINLKKEDEYLSAQTDDGRPVRLYFTDAARAIATLFSTSTTGVHAEELLPHLLPLPKTEEEIYDRAKLQYIVPELRETEEALELAREYELPELLEPADVKGVLHAHSTYSDGSHTLRDMAEASAKRGYTYLGITDHSQTAAYAGGLSIARVREQHKEVDMLNKANPAFRIFKGIESDILPDGRLDYPDEVLAEFDFVIASVHAVLTMDEQTATERLLKAIRNPYTSIMGHLTGRLLLTREGYPVNHVAIIEACAEHGVAIEINASPYRLDLDWTWVRYATERGVLIAINPDAHSTQGIDDIRYGVAIGRKGLLTSAQTLNAKTAEEFAAWCSARKPANRK